MGQQQMQPQLTHLLFAYFLIALVFKSLFHCHEGHLPVILWDIIMEAGKKD